MRRILGLLAPYRARLVAALALAVAVVVTTLLLPVLTGAAVDAVVGPGEVDMGALLRSLAGMAAAFCATSAAQWALTATTNRVAYRVVRDLRDRAFDRLQELPVSYIDARRRGDSVSRIVTDAEQFSNGLVMAFQQFFTGALTIVLTLAFMFRLNAAVTVVAVVVTPVSFVVARFIAQRGYRYYREQTARRGAMTSVAEEALSGLSTVEAYGAAPRVLERFDAADELLRQSSFKAVFYSSLTNPSTRFVNSLVYAGVGVAGAFAVLGGTLSVGGLSAFLAYANQYTKPFNDISEVVSELQNSVACANRLFDLIDQPAEVPDAPGAVELEDVRGEVELADVSFSYTPARPLLQGISLKARPGDRVAIVGPTGCGKTTLINLLMRFYDVDGGSISVDGHDVRDVTRASLRRAFGMVLQDTWLANGTVRENIALGRPGASLEEVRAAAREAFADEFIMRLPQGYDTVVGAEGSSLSEGQRQLVCIARVMLARPAMLILDEATSSIDTRTELAVQRAFDKLMEGRTSFVVAHRLSTVRDADVILVMRDGCVVERGTHDELLALDGFYAQLHRAQFEGSRG